MAIPSVVAAVTTVMNFLRAIAFIAPFIRASVEVETIPAARAWPSASWEAARIVDWINTYGTSGAMRSEQSVRSEGNRRK